MEKINNKNWLRLVDRVSAFLVLFFYLLIVGKTALLVGKDPLVLASTWSAKAVYPCTAALVEVGPAEESTCLRRGLVFSFSTSSKSRFLLFPMTNKKTKINACHVL